MQKTNFRFEVIVHDDASTDGTAVIIKEFAERYPNIIKPLYETENQYSKHNGSLRRIMDAHMRGKYIAYCEGDDYWIDPLKLQKQVDVLEANPEYSMCCANCIDYIQKNGKMRYSPLTNKNVIVLDDLLYNRNMIATLTALCRKDLILEYNSKLFKLLPKWPLGDYPLWIWMSTKGKIYKIPDITAVYRIFPGSASHSEDENKGFFFGLSGYEVQLFFCTLLDKSSFSVNVKRKCYVLRFVGRRFWRQLDKLKYLFQIAFS
ncbi:glycosyltransferase [Bacteroides timonensis]|uniref:glycosyltransferase n=1 Tax=Bacteroides timonensis TaxID=1470345 RepID=UPI00373FDD32